MLQAVYESGVTSVIWFEDFSDRFSLSGEQRAEHGRFMNKLVAPSGGAHAATVKAANFEPRLAPNALGTVFTPTGASARYNQKLWMSGGGKAAYPDG